jgi:UDP-glucose 4-epimerase
VKLKDWHVRNSKLQMNLLHENVFVRSMQIWSDCQKIREVMGWDAEYTDVEKSLGHAWAWRQSHPYGYG